MLVGRNVELRTESPHCIGNRYDDTASGAEGLGAGKKPHYKKCRLTVNSKKVNQHYVQKYVSMM